MLCRVGAGRQSAFDGRLGENASVIDHLVDGVDCTIEVVLDRVEVAVVVVGDRWRDIALGNAVDIVGGHIERSDNGIQRVVDTLDDFAEITFVFGRVGAGCQSAFDGGLGQHVGIGDQCVDHIDAGIQVALDRIEVTLVAIGNLRRDITLGDAINIVRGDIQRLDDGIERLVDALNHRAESTLV